MNESDVTVLVFGPLRERIGAAELHATGSTVAAVWDQVARAHGLDGFPAGVRAALNREYCEWEAAVVPGDVIAFLPPVAGGSGAALGWRIRVAITDTPIDMAAATNVAGDGDGALAAFVGRVRNHSEGHRVLRIDYEAYVEMAESEMWRIAEALMERDGVSAIAITHRVGRLEVGDASVVVAVSGPHRAAALAACGDAIDMVKATVPIWKREHRDDGTRWVDARHGAQHGTPKERGTGNDAR